MSLHRESVHIQQTFIPNQTREQREKQLLLSRNTPDNRTSYTTYNVSDNILAVDPCNKSLYSDSKTQYNKSLTAADVLKNEQQQARQRKQQIITNKYNSMVHNDNQRLAQQQQVKADEIQRIDRIIQRQQQYTNNHTTLPYNPITLAYNNTEAGRELLYRDNITKYNSLYRMQQVDLRYNGDLNPITGVANKRIVLPEKPVRTI